MHGLAKHGFQPLAALHARGRQTVEPDPFAAGRGGGTRHGVQVFHESGGLQFPPVPDDLAHDDGEREFRAAEPPGFPEPRAEQLKILARLAGPSKGENGRECDIGKAVGRAVRQRGHPLRHMHQKLVPGIVAHLAVDLSQRLERDRHHLKTEAAPHLQRNILEKRRPVAQLGERVLLHTAGLKIAVKDKHRRCENGAVEQNLRIKKLQTAEQQRHGRQRPDHMAHTARQHGAVAHVKSQGNCQLGDHHRITELIERAAGVVPVL